MGPTRFPSPNPTCKICDKRVLYTERKRCIECGDWIHNFCGNESGEGYKRRTTCFDCSPPCSTMHNIDSLIRELDHTWEPETYKSGVIFLASLHFGPDEAKIVELTGYTPEEVKIRGDRLRENRVWEGDKIILDPNPTEDARISSIILLMNILCADGMIARVSDPKESTGSQGATANARAE